MSDCEHLDFEAHVAVNRIENMIGEWPFMQFAADVHIKCAECGKPFQFIGLPGGLAPNRPTRSVDGTEARLPIAPEPRTFEYPIGLPIDFARWSNDHSD